MLYAVQLSSCKRRAVPRDIGVAALVAVGQPLPDVARHVAEAEGFRLVPSDRQIERPVIGRDAGVAGQQRECPFRTANASNSTIIPVSSGDNDRSTRQILYRRTVVEVSNAKSGSRVTSVTRRQ